MLTQGPARDPKCKLNMPSFLTLPHLSDCVICTRNSMSIVLLLRMVGGWDIWAVVDLEQGVGGGTEGEYYLVVSVFDFFFFTFAFFFCFLMSSVPFLSD